MQHLVWLTVAAVFIADLLLPQRFDVVFAYLLPHFLAIRFKEKNDVLLLAAATTTLTVLAVVLVPHEGPLEELLIQHIIPITCFWLAAFFALRFLSLRQDERQQQDRFEALFTHAIGGILLANQQGRIVMANPALEKLFGYDAGELLGKPIETLIPQRYGSVHEKHRAEFAAQPRPRSMGQGLDLYGRKKDGTEFPVEVSLSPIEGSKGGLVTAFVVDNTFRKNYEQSLLKKSEENAALSEALQKLNEELESKVAARTRELEAAKNDLSAALDKERELGELKSRFVSMASHEFRTPLTSILSSAGLIGQYAERQDAENILKHSARIKNAVNGLNTILSEFLSLGRLEEGRVHLKEEDVSLPACVEAVREEMAPLFKPGQVLEYRHEGPEVVRSDGGLLKNILINFVSNASKYSPENSLFVVESRTDSRSFRISVRDRGMGIPEAEQKHLFERFFRAGNAVNTTQGTGLGLYIVQRYAEMLGGHVGFSSSVDEGSEFWVEVGV